MSESNSYENELDEAIDLAKRAVGFDENECHAAAAYFYEVAAKLLMQYLENCSSSKNIENAIESSKYESLRNKANEYIERALVLKESLENNEAANFRSQNEKDDELSQCYFLFDEGLNADEAQLPQVALQFYLKALEIGLRLKLDSEELRKKLKSVLVHALDRAETIKKSSGKENSKEEKSNAKKFSGNEIKNQRQIRIEKKPGLEVGKGNLSDEEKKVLLKTSTINKIEYVPFMNIDLSERFQYAEMFIDPNKSQLELSAQQQRELDCWIRPKQISSNPCIFQQYPPNYLTIKQTVVSDCSFVASLAVCALHESKFRTPLISSIFYPKNRDNVPRYNPFGKYMLKFNLNGIKRKIIIDDRLPYGRHGQLLCSYSSNRNEFWVSLLEKAYMKVMGGYNFPGSNGNIDLHVLTGWIPDRRQIDSITNKFEEFEKLEANMRKGNVLVTIATGDLSEYDAKRSGLVPLHAYAVLDVRTVRCRDRNFQLLQMKNPWSHLRWKGNFSELDRVHWTADLQSQLNYDPSSAIEFDNGVFWIDFDSVCRFFHVFYFNWNFGLFPFTYSLHKEWKAGQGPIKDIFDISSNPQFMLKTSNSSYHNSSNSENNSKINDSIWILLTRHITNIDDFKNNCEYITVLVYENDGKKIYYPDDPMPFIDGIRINSPHYLCKIENTNLKNRKFTLVISQYEKTQTIYYTIRVYSTCPFQLYEIPDKYSCRKEICGEWTEQTSGGCPNNAQTYKLNPKFLVDFSRSASDTNEFVIDLKAPRQYQIGFEVRIVAVTNNETVTAPFKSQLSGPYRSGFVYMELVAIPAGKFEIIPSSFLPNQICPFILSIKASCTFDLQKVR